MTDTTPAAMEVARFEIEQVGAIGTMEDGTETITMGVLLSGDVAAIKWAGTHIFSSAVLMRAIDHAALAAELATARAERDEARKEVGRMLYGIREASDPDFLYGAMDNVRDMDARLEDYAAAASRGIRSALIPSDPRVTALVDAASRLISVERDSACEMRAVDDVEAAIATLKGAANE